jgi:hypothetical protein
MRIYALALRSAQCTGKRRELLRSALEIRWKHCSRGSLRNSLIVSADYEVLRESEVTLALPSYRSTSSPVRAA